MARAEEEEVSTPEAVAGEKPPPEESSEPAGEAEAKQQLKWAIEGYIYEDLRYRHAGGEDDLDSYTHVYLDATRRVGRPYHFRFNGRLNADLAGSQAPNDLLRDFWDSYNGDVQFRLYEAYGDVPHKTLLFRIGRQFLDEGNYFHVDGLRVDIDLSQKWKGVDVTVIGGVPVRLSGTSTDANWMIGAVLRARINKKTRLRLSYYHVSESFPGINSPVIDPINQPVSIPAGRLDDDLFGLTVWHNFQRTLRFFGRFTVLNGDANELQLRLRWFTEDGRWTVVADWFQLFERLNNVTNDLTPYVPMMGSYFPFWRLGARVTYRPDEVWVVQGGIGWRQLENSSNEGTFNHSYVNYYVTATRLDAWKPGLDVTVTLNGYDSSEPQDFLALTTNVDYRVNPKVKVSGGIDYSLYKYIWFSNSEREDVWTYFVRVRWEVREKVTLDGVVSVDDDRFATWTTVSARVTWRF
ncbi:MAG: hypothetical protein ACYS6Z_12010 [Planctomycetota bacterium]